VCAALAALAGCSGRSCSGEGEAPLAALEPGYRAAMARARAWLDGLRVDPFELRAVRVKGKKKFVEQLDAYYRLWEVAPAADRPALLERIRQVVAITYEDRYHDMASLGDRWFKQDSTSYLRAALLMERLGLDTTRYREEIRRIHARLDGHMKTRGPHQRRVFHWYYKHFGLAEPFPLEGSLRDGVIARRLEPTKMKDGDAYALTHEVYALYEYGERRDIDPFDEADKAYLRPAIEALMRRYQVAGDPDIAGELLECLHYLRMQDSPAYLEGVAYLLATQRPEGSWDRRAREAKPPWEYADQAFRLHTTLVAISALTAVFERPMPPP